MKLAKYIVALTLLIPTTAQAYEELDVDAYIQDGYGTDVHADQYGRPFRWSEFGSRNVQVDGYGENAHRDQYGRHVRAVTHGAANPVLRKVRPELGTGLDPLCKVRPELWRCR